jgi:hypothetical protein
MVKDSMEEIKIEFTKKNREDMLSLLKEKVFHLTKKDAYERILTSGIVCNNKDGCFKLNTSSGNSLGRLSGYVCLFDIRGKSDSEIDDILGKYYFLRPNWFKEVDGNYFEWNLAYMILSPEYYEQLIPYEKMRELPDYSSGKFIAIPGAEVGIKDRVPVEWFCKTYLVRIREPALELGSYARAVMDSSSSTDSE